MIKKPPVVVIEWVDASTDTGPIAVEDMKPLVRLHLVGWLVREDKASVSVAQEYKDRTDQYRFVAHIPKVNIVKMKRLRG